MKNTAYIFFNISIVIILGLVCGYDLRLWIAAKDDLPEPIFGKT